LKCGFQKKVCASKSPTFFSRKPLVATSADQKDKLKMKERSKVFYLLTTILFLIFANYCLARAGGGGGIGGGGGGILTTILAFILAPFFLIYSIIVSIKLTHRNNKVQDLTAELAKGDKIWNHRNMMATVEQVFFKVQEAWMERNQDLAKDVMSERIYQKHKMQTDAMIDKGVKNILEKMNLEEVMIISISDYLDNSEDKFSVYLKGSMIDYTINDTTYDVISGDNSKSETFKEIWTFIRDRHKWKLDEIDQNVTMGDIDRSKAFSEKFKNRI
jgi:preprotein translocase subunit YajC